MPNFMPSSIIAAPHTIALALKALEAEKGAKLKFLSEVTYAKVHAELASQTEGEFLAGKAAIGTAEPVNEFLKERGFNLTFPNPDPTDIVCAGIIDIKVAWREEGSQQHLIWLGKKSVESTRLKRFVTFQAENHPSPIFQLLTKESYRVYVTKAYGTVANNFLDLQQSLRKLTSKLSPSHEQFAGIELPMLNLKQRGALPIFNELHLNIGGESFYGSNGQYEAILKLNHKGAVAKAAAGGMLIRACVQIDPEYVFNSPFWFWIVKDGHVYFAAQIEEDALGNPKDLQ